MDSITRDDLDRLLKGISRHVDQPSRLVLEAGSPTYGRAWRLFVSTRHGGRGGLRTFLDLSNGYIGWTKREAYCTLSGLLSGLEAGPMVELGEPDPD